ncbi:MULTISPECIES: hypothetical protein [Ralstonia solanacearum species complex]|uniref:Uncharacterized protein n=1 Tax=Ralstonia solanacearum IPO1609 TaxID=564066 RepID=A0ABF7RC14_RALSL|nr:hypothetical protein [Ralstonia solanacearum]ALF88334.1 hypothetical protein RSUY_19990 [Ralstonia solanacearum]ATI27790.1 hypothetical protein CCY86_10005 [Ralstonia solanacearum]ATJ86546.1 hypothetical protein CDC59_09925 [Ralstonia solanacearum]MDN4066171.1 hypothetical protein [Ralstonia solanacearum]NUU73656.1 hypothetical protein [Ralstonia solanacearum]
MANVVTLLDHWQTLVGAFIGGLMGVVGALIVAVLTVRRQRWVMASALLPDMQQLRAADDALERALHSIDPPLGEWVRSQWCAERLAQTHPTLSALHDGVAVTQVSDLDARLSAHLMLCRMRHKDLDALLQQFVAALHGSRAPMPAANVPAAMTVVRRSAKRVQQAWDLCVEHGTLAEYLLDRLIFNRWPNIWHRLRMRWWPNDLDHRSMHLLNSGSILGTQDSHQDDVAG